MNLRLLWPEAPPSWRQPASWRTLLGSLPNVLVLSTVAGVLLALTDSTTPLLLHLAMSNLTGLSAWGGAITLRRVFRGRISTLAAWLIAALPASLLSQSLAGYILDHQPLNGWLQDPWQESRWLASGLLLTFVAVTFAMRDRAASEYRVGLAAEQRQVAEARQGEALARLALLQAQIEPHFLFNTLANVQSMIEREPRTAARMLEHLDQYLRAALGRSRAPTSTCAQEMELIEALLAIAAIRLGPRLSYTLELPEELRAARLPPLLLQPLVENALKHGIEPAVEGGDIGVTCSSCDGRLVLRVRDTGLGFQQGAPAGVGLANIRARLASLYGARGQLTLHRNEPRGTVAEIALPLTLEGAEP